MTSAQYVINSFLDSQGLPKSTHFNMNKPEKSITMLTNYVLRKYLDMDTDVSGYVKSAVAYIKVSYLKILNIFRFTFVFFFYLNIASKPISRFQSKLL